MNPIKKMILALIILLSAVQVQGHPLHLTVTNIDITDHNLKITIRVFQDDYAEMLRQYNNSTDTQSLEIINHYISNHFKLWCENEPLTLFFTSITHDEQSTYISCELNLTNRCQQLTIQNTLFCSWFPDQKNLVILNANNTEKGFEFSITYPKKTITLVE